MSACTVYGLGNRCSDNNEIARAGQLFTAGCNARSDLISEVRVKVRGQMCGRRFSEIAAINIKPIYQGYMVVAKNMEGSDFTSEVKVRGQL